MKLKKIMNSYSLFTHIFHRKPTELALSKFLTSDILYIDRISEFPTCLSEFPNLKQLEFGSCKFKLPAELTLPNLRILKLHHCNLTDITPLCQLTTLTDLSVYFNEISFLPYELNSLINLEYLNISHNLLTEIPYLLDLTKLQLVYLNFNPLHSVSTLKNKFHYKTSIQAEYVARISTEKHSSGIPRNS